MFLHHVIRTEAGELHYVSPGGTALSSPKCYIWVSVRSMGQNRYWPSAFWIIILALAALLWAAPVGLRHLLLTSLPTRIYYCVLVLGGIALFVGGTCFLFVRKVERNIAFAVSVTALVLAVNQATGLTFNTILCFSAG
jgi:hypothetical protein